MLQPSLNVPWIQMERANTPEVTPQELVWTISSKHPSQYKNNCFLYATVKIWDRMHSHLAPGISPLAIFTKQYLFPPGMEWEAFKPLIDAGLTRPSDLLKNGKIQEKEQLERGRISNPVVLVPGIKRSNGASICSTGL